MYTDFMRVVRSGTVQKESNFWCWRRLSFSTKKYRRCKHKPHRPVDDTPSIQLLKTKSAFLLLLYWRHFNTFWPVTHKVIRQTRVHYICRLTQCIPLPPHTHTNPELLSPRLQNGPDYIFKSLHSSQSSVSHSLSCYTLPPCHSVFLSFSQTLLNDPWNCNVMWYWLHN